MHICDTSRTAPSPLRPVCRPWPGGMPDLQGAVVWPVVTASLAVLAGVDVSPRWPLLHGQVNTDELARQFADLGSPEQLQEYWKGNWARNSTPQWVHQPPQDKEAQLPAGTGSGPKSSGSPKFYPNRSPAGSTGSPVNRVKSLL